MFSMSFMCLDIQNTSTWKLVFTDFLHNLLWISHSRKSRREDAQLQHLVHRLLSQVQKESLKMEESSDFSSHSHLGLPRPAGKAA